MKDIISRLLDLGGTNNFLFFQLLKYQYLLGNQNYVSSQEHVHVTIGHYS